MLCVGLLVFLALLQQTWASLSMCSSTNTGSDSTLTTSLYMSNGLCKDTCSDSGYALAVVLDESCWCSNTAPGSTVSTSECSDDCPGYPSEKCGNESENLYGYIELSTPSSTEEDSSSSSGTSTTSSSSSTSTSSTSRSSSSSDTSTSSSSISSSTTSSSSKTSSSSSPSSSSTVPSSTSSSSATPSMSSSATKTSISASSSEAPVTSVVYSVVTITGSASAQATTTEVVSTIVSLPSSSSTSGSSQSKSSSSNSFFDSPGKVAGTFVVVGLVVLAIVGALLYFCCFKRKSEKDEESLYEDNGSEMSPSSLHEKHYDTNGTTQAVPINNQANKDNVDLNHGEFLGDDDGFNFVEVDQRLDPKNVFMNWENGSRKSLADDLDYSRRVLRVTNE